MSKVGAALRSDFPFFSDDRARVNRHYLDNAATTQKPRVVIDAMYDSYVAYSANVGRGVYHLAEEVTVRYQQARDTVAAYMGAQAHETIFVPSATYGLNMLAYSWTANIRPSDSIVITQLEHHANFIPWLMAAKRTGAQLRVIPINTMGQLCLDQLANYVDDSTKIVAISSMSNVTGLPTPLEPVVARARAVGAKIVIDACQTAPLGPFDVLSLGCDALVFSGHKMGGPTGIGILYLRETIQQHTPPAFFGGGMVREVLDPSVAHISDSEQPIALREAPDCYEAGTPPIVQAIGLAAAIDYLRTLHQSALTGHYHQLMQRLVNGLTHNERITIIGDPDVLARQAHLLSFTVDGMHAHDVAAYLSECAVCVRAGDHCAHPLVHALGVQATVRASLFVYNDNDDIDALLSGLAALPHI